jgi:hypothetical protein
MRRILLLSALFAASCSDVGGPGPQGPAGATASPATINLVRFTSDTSVCPSGAGVIIEVVHPSSPLGATVVEAASIVCDGSNGHDGLNGQNGQNGSPGTVITPVQFCSPGFVPSYPNSFPEYGLCIDNVLYGVYSQNGGFLAKLPPGSYSSNGINASCTFTITAGCGVSN